MTSVSIFLGKKLVARMSATSLQETTRLVHVILPWLMKQHAARYEQIEVRYGEDKLPKRHGGVAI